MDLLIEWVEKLRTPCELPKKRIAADHEKSCEQNSSTFNC